MTKFRFAIAFLSCVGVAGCVNGPRWEAAMQRGKQQLQAGDLNAAEHSFNDAFEQAQRLHRWHPYQLETNTELARLYFKMGSYDRGKAALVRVIERLEVLQNAEDPGLGRLHSELGRVCDLLGQYDEARAHYLRALPVAMKTPAENQLDYLYLDMAVNAARRKAFAEADQYFENAQTAAQVLHPGGAILEEIRARRAEMRSR